MLSLGQLYTANTNDDDNNDDDDNDDNDNNDDNNTNNDDNDTWWTNHDCIGSLACMPKSGKQKDIYVTYRIFLGYWSLFCMCVPADTLHQWLLTFAYAVTM